MTLQSDLGEIVSIDHYWDGFYIVRLDQPALHHNPDGSIEECAEIREAVDNLTIVTP